jgi:excisionase family DNA binding protein
VIALMTIPEVALKLRVSERTVRREIKRGRLRVKRIGRSVFVIEPELERYLLAEEPRRA